MTRNTFSILGALLFVTVAGVAGAQESDLEATAAEEATPENRTIVVLASGDAGVADLLGVIAQSVGQVAEEKGYTLVDPDRVDSFVGAMDRQPETEEDLAGVGRFLGAAAVLHASTRDAGNGELALTIKAVFPGEGNGGFQTRIVTRASAPAQVRAMTRKVLVDPEPEAEPEQVVVGALPVAPATTPWPAVAVQPTLAYVGEPQGASALMLPSGAVAPPRPSDEELNEIPPGRVMGGTPNEAGRVAGVFGLTAGVQAGLWMISLMTWIAIDENEEDSIFDEDKSGPDEDRQRATYIGYVYLGVAPAISSVLAWAMGNGSDYYDVKYGPVVGGAYVGSAAALGLMLIANYTEATEAVPFCYVLAPILLPAAGAAIGYALGRTPEEGLRKIGMTPLGPAVALNDEVQWILPQPVAVPAMDGSRGSYVGLSLGTLRF